MGSIGPDPLFQAEDGRRDRATGEGPGVAGGLWERNHGQDDPYNVDVGMNMGRA